MLREGDASAADGRGARVPQAALARAALSAGAMVADRVVRPMAVVIVGRA
jgi:hypothetical protein